MTTPVKYPFLDLAADNAPYVDDIAAATARVVRSGRYVGGPEVESFEAMLAADTGTAFAVGVGSGLDALRLILRAYIELGRLAPGDQVIVPANTYIATVLAVTDCGLVPVPVEASPRTLNMDTSLLRRAITPRTRAIMTVHLYGRICYDAELESVAREHDLLVIEDNAQAIGATAADGRRSGALGHAAAFSFYPTKNVGGMGEGGAVTTNDPELARTVRALANYGSDRQYHNIYKGFNCRFDPMQAAVLKVKLPHVDRESDRRRLLAAVYDRTITNPLVHKPHYDAGARDMVWHQYVICTPERDRLREWLLERGVQTAIHYPTPPHRQPCMPELAHLSLPVTERLADEVISLPMGAATSEADAAAIAAIINEFK